MAYRWRSGSAIVLLASATVSASVFEPVSDRQLVCEAAHVVRGRVTSVRSAWDTAHTAIWTTASLQVDGTIRGALGRGAVATIKEVGGTVDGFTIRGEQFPTFREGEELVVLLRPWDDGSGAYRVWGYGRGMFVVERGPDGKAGSARRYDVVETGRPVMVTDQVPAVIVVERLEEQLRGLARGCGQGGGPTE